MDITQVITTLDAEIKRQEAELQSLRKKLMAIGQEDRPTTNDQCLMDAVLSCPHFITAESVTLHFCPRQKEGHDALSQLQHRLADYDLAARQREMQLLAGRDRDAGEIGAECVLKQHGPVAHDEDLLEQLYREFDAQRRRTGEERLAFKVKMRSYASEFRRRSVGKMTFAQSVSDDMMNLVDRLGSEHDDVDPRAWKHLLVYAPQATPQPSPTAQGDEKEHAAEATPIAWYVTGCSTMLDEIDAKAEAKRCGGSAKAVPLYTAPPVQQQPDLNKAAECICSNLPDFEKLDRGFRWVSEKQHHVPTLLIEFEPIPANSPVTEKGWQDRDALAAFLTDHTK